MLPFPASARAALPRSFLVCFVCIWCVLLAACGGGDGGSTSSGSSSASNSSGSSNSSNSANSGVATSTIAAAAGNVATITVEQGPNASFANTPFVTVKVCAVGTSTCDTIDHVLVDSGSVGLRLFSSQIPNSLASLARQTISSNFLNECGTFVSGYTWGTVRLADVTISGENASNVPIQVIGDPAAGSTAPSACMTAGSNNNLSTVNAMGANGILGVEGLAVDCGAACATSNAVIAYYACNSSGGSCATTAVPTSSQLQNVVRMFPTDNNGVIIEMPQISASGATSATGALVFGIGTQSNNALGQATMLQTDSSFSFNSTYNGVTYANSFVDSGSSDFFFYDALLTRCTSAVGYYCPSATTAESATLTPTSGSGGAGSYAASFSVANAETLFNTSNYAFNDVAVYQSAGASLGMDFGMPFFYGKNVFVKIETKSDAADGYLAFASNSN